MCQFWRPVDCNILYLLYLPTADRQAKSRAVQSRKNHLLLLRTLIALLALRRLLHEGWEHSAATK